MESDQENSSVDMDDQSSTTGSDHSSRVTDESIWDRIQRVTWTNNNEFWLKLLNEDKTLFRMRFKEFFIESCKRQLYLFHQFIENDETWSSLMETKSQLYEEVSEDDESFFSAVDKRKYMLLKTIDWGKVESELLAEPNDDSNTRALQDVSFGLTEEEDY